MELKPGITHTETTVVDRQNTASAVGSGPVDVFATPMMVALLEQAAARCIEGCLGEGKVSVGTHIDVSHSGATPVGMKVSATATVTEVDRGRVEFDIVVRDECGEVGRGSHTRFIVDRARFMERAGQKGK